MAQALEVAGAPERFAFKLQKSLSVALSVRHHSHKSAVERSVLPESSQSQIQNLDFARSLRPKFVFTLQKSLSFALSV